MSAQKARGADFETGSLMQRAKALLPILVPLFVSAFRRADELAVAMESRCYHGGEGRTRMKQLGTPGAISARISRARRCWALRNFGLWARTSHSFWNIWRLAGAVDHRRPDARKKFGL
jgi:energy-coupling factor transport system permease protein